MFNRYFIPLLIVLPLLFQCSRNEQPVDPSTDSIYHLVEEVKIGTLEGDSLYMFGDISSVAIGKKGEFYVADPQVTIVRMYDSNGIYLKDIGDAGRGPGEFLYIGGMEVMSDGKLATWDQRNMRINIYSPEGNYLNSHLVAASTYTAHTFQVDHDDNFYVKSSFFHPEKIKRRQLSWLKVSQNGEIIDTLLIPTKMEEGPQTYVLMTTQGFAFPFTERLIIWPSSLGYLITGNNDTYSIDLNLPEEDPKTISREYISVKILPEEKAEWRAQNRNFGTNNIIPDVKPAYKDILTDSDGRIWVHRYVDAVMPGTEMHTSFENLWWEQPTFDVFLPDGSFSKTVILPWNVIFQDADDQYVWGILTGKKGEEYVVRYRMEQKL